MNDSAIFFVMLTAAGTLLIGAVLALRAVDQRGRDAARVIVRLGFPRGLRPEQVTAVVRLAVGTAPATSGVVGRAGIVFEIVGSRRGVDYRLRLPRSAADNLRAQLRAAVPGVAITEITDFKPERLARAVELRRALSDRDLAVTDVAATCRTIIAALSELRSGETAVWQLVLTGGVSTRPTSPSIWQLLTVGAPDASTRRRDPGVMSAVLRLGAGAKSARRTAELLARLRRAAQSVSAPGARLTPRLLPSEVVTGRIGRASTPLTSAPTLLTPDEGAALLGWPVGDPLIAGLNLGGSPQLPASSDVPRTGRVLGRSTVDDRLVAQPLRGAVEHSLIVGPTGSGKTHLSVALFLGDVAAGRGGLAIDPKGGLIRSILERLPEEALARTVLLSPIDEKRPVPFPVLAAEGRSSQNLAADTFIGILRHLHRDLGPRSTDILTSSLYALAHVPNATLMDLFRLWSDATYRASVVGRLSNDPVLSGFFAWFDGLTVAERSFMLAAPLNKIRPLVQRPAIRNVIAAPHATFSLGQAMRERLIVLADLPEGRLGADATTLLGQMIFARAWTAIQARRERTLFNVTVDEAARFLDQPTDMSDVLARSREYGVGITLVTQTLSMFPSELREVAMNSARTKIAFGTSHADARRLAAEFGPGVEPDYFAGLARFEAIGAVSLGGTVSRPFTFRTEELDAPIPGRAAEVRRASRERFGIDRAEIEAAILRQAKGPDEPTGKVGRRRT